MGREDLPAQTSENRQWGRPGVRTSSHAAGISDMEWDGDTRWDPRWEDGIPMGYRWDTDGSSPRWDRRDGGMMGG